MSSQLKLAEFILAHVAPVAPVSHLAPLGIVKSNTAAELVQLLTTLASVQGSHVVVVPTLIVAAVPVSPLSHLSPLDHVSPLGQASP